MACIESLSCACKGGICCTKHGCMVLGLCQQGSLAMHPRQMCSLAKSSIAAALQIRPTGHHPLEKAKQSLQACTRMERASCRAEELGSYAAVKGAITRLSTERADARSSTCLPEMLQHRRRLHPQMHSQTWRHTCLHAAGAHTDLQAAGVQLARSRVSQPLQSQWGWVRCQSGPRWALCRLRGAPLPAPPPARRPAGRRHTLPR